MGAAFATLVTNADYALGAATLLRSIRRTGAAQPVVVLAKAGVDGLDRLERLGGSIVEVEPLPLSASFAERHRRDRLHASAPFTKGEKPAFHDPLDNFLKLRLWQLDRYRRVLFIDADAVVLRDPAKLFAYPEFAAAPNVYASLADFGRLNSGVFVAQPRPATFEAMLESLDRPDAFWRRTDQTFLQHWFPDWQGLPVFFNMLQYVYLNLPELWIWKEIRILHYQYEKPWQADHPKRAALQPLIDLWWRLHDGGAPPDDLPAPRASA